MYHKIMVPTDLIHLDELEKSLKTAADLSKLYGAPIVYIGVTGTKPDEAAHNPAVYQQQLDNFARDQAEKHAIETSGKVYSGDDLSSDLDAVLLDALLETHCDLVVIASHTPTSVSGYFLPSHGGKLASQSSATVMLVR